MRALFDETQSELGFGIDNVLTADLSLSPVRYPTTTQARVFFRELLDRASVLPGVDGAAIGNTVPGGLATTIANISVPNTNTGAGVTGSADDFVRYETVSANYFRTLNIGIAAGRGFTAYDRSNAMAVAVINEAFATLHWLDLRAAIGQRIAFGNQAFVVVGVAKNIRGVRSQAEPVAYFLYDQFQQPPKQVTLFLHFATGSTSLAEPVRRLVQSVDSTQPVYNLKTLEAIAFAPLARLRFISNMTVAFSLLAALIAIIGVYGAMSRVVDERMTELAIRLALGSEPRQLFREVLARAGLVVSVGVVCGLLAAYYAVPVLRANVVGLDATPLGATLIAALVTVVGASIGATIIPAARAALVDPVVLLRRQ